MSGSYAKVSGALPMRNYIRRCRQLKNDATTEFIELYKRLESAIRDKYDVPQGTGAVSWLIRNERGFGGVHDELNYCREVRNLLQHGERVRDDYAVVPSAGMIESIRSTIERVEGLPRAIDLCVKTRDVYSVSLTDPMLAAMRVMCDKSYSHLPILEDGRVVGVFSAKSLFTYLIEDGITTLDESMTFEQVAGLLPLDKHGSETFAFVPQEMLATNIAELFQRARSQSKRLGVVFVTAHGKQNERLLGMLTAWDMAAFF